MTGRSTQEFGGRP